MKLAIRQKYTLTFQSFFRCFQHIIWTHFNMPKYVAGAISDKQNMTALCFFYAGAGFFWIAKEKRMV
jgi:hypothetical protein